MASAISKLGITVGVFRVDSTPTRQRAEFQESRVAVDVPSRFPRSRRFFATLLAISLIDSVCGISQPKVVRASSVIASTATEFARERVQIELPRIMTWRPLPVATPVLTRRPRLNPNRERKVSMRQRIERRRHGGANRPTSGWWLSTTRWAMQSARLAGRLFSAKDREGRQAGEAIIESFDEPFEDTGLADDQSEPIARTDPPAAPRNVAGNASVIRKSDRSSRERVVLFAPGPITEADLLRGNLKRAATIRRHQRRLIRFRCLTDNAGTIVAVIGLVVLVWFVAAG